HHHRELLRPIVGELSVHRFRERDPHLIARSQPTESSGTGSPRRRRPHGAVGTRLGPWRYRGTRCQLRFRVQVVKPSLESVLSATSWVQLATYDQYGSSCQASVSKLVATWRMNRT